MTDWIITICLLVIIAEFGFMIFGKRVDVLQVKEEKKALPRGSEVNTELKEWIPPENEEKKVFEGILKGIQK